MASISTTHSKTPPTGRRLAQLTLLALGVVYGDIGTSPLYALRECFGELHGLPPTPDNVYGVLSLILWSLIIVVSIKYIVFVMRADNRGEGGILSMVALILQRKHSDADRRTRQIVIVLGLIGTALLYGDGMITPAMSILSATEGLEVVTPVLKRLAVPLTAMIIIVLFFFQKRGTAGVGKIFGPVTLIWFVTIAVLGLIQIFQRPEVLLAANPWYGVKFFMHEGFHSFVILGSVVLAVTGAEALYADMGHFGRRSIRIAWFGLVLPSLVLNYFGQGALILSDPATAANPFFMLAPRVLLYPLIALAIAAAIIASQAMISGAFSLTQQCVQLGYFPRVNIVHTSESEAGQIYVPEINWGLMVGCLLILFGFRNSSALGAAYGIAVTGTFILTTSLLFVAARTWWNWSLPKALAITGVFFVVDLAFLGANVLKIKDGGWVPLAAGALIFMMMTTWNRGRGIIQRKLSANMLTLDEFFPSIARNPPARVPGIAVFMARDSSGAPGVLMHHLKHNKVLHEKVILLSIKLEEIPKVDPSSRVTVEELPEGFYRVIARYGFMESPDVPAIMAMTRDFGIDSTLMNTSYYLGREQLLARKRTPEQLAYERNERKEKGLPEERELFLWRKRLFSFMSRNSRSASEFFNLPANRVVELGTQVEF